METMPHHLPQPAPVDIGAWTPASERDWRRGLPVLRGLGFVLRELELSDAAPLTEQLTAEQVTRFISPPPADVAGFERFIEWTHREREAGRYTCFAVVPDGEDRAVGLFQIRKGAGEDGLAEWGFILAASHWGTGLFLAGAERVVDFAFTELGIQRLEARAAVANGRGQGALAKIGAVKEAVLRQSFERRGERLDQTLWAILRHDWQRRRRPSMTRHH